MNDNQAYIPGMCNINKAEVAYRKKAMWFGIAVSVVVLAVMIGFALPIVVRVLLFVPIYIAAIGYLQVKNKFCVAYGASGKQNASEGSANALEVAEAEAKAADKKKSRKMNLQAFGLTVIVLVLVMLVPNI